MTDPNMGRPAISSSWSRGFIGPAPPDQQLTSTAYPHPADSLTPPRGFAWPMQAVTATPVVVSAAGLPPPTAQIPTQFPEKFKFR